jgi:hypothetical protein
MKLILNLCAICFICSTRGIIIDLVFVVVLSNAKGLAILENDVNSGTSFGHLDDHEKVPPDVGAHTHFVPACLSRTQGAPLSYACRNCSTALKSCANSHYKTNVFDNCFQITVIDYLVSLFNLCHHVSRKSERFHPFVAR